MTETPPRGTVLLIGLQDPDAQALEASMPEGIVLETLGVEAFRTRDQQAAAAATLGCFVGWEKAPALISMIRDSQLLWLIHGVGLGLVGSGVDPHATALLAELGVEDVMDVSGGDKKSGRLVDKWRRRETRHQGVILRLMRDLDTSFVAQDYDKARQLVDSLVLLDPRKRFYLDLLSIQMREAGRTDKVEESLRRALINWPRHVKALAGLCEHYAGLDDPSAARAFGKQIVEAYGQTLVDALLGPTDLFAGDAFLATVPQTARLLTQLYGTASAIGFARTYAGSLEAAKASADLAIFTAILQQSGHAAVLAGLPGRGSPAAPAATAPTAAPTVPSAGSPPVAAARVPAPAPAALASLDVPPPARDLSDSSQQEALATAGKTEPDCAVKTGAGTDIVYKSRVLVFHPEAGGYKRLAKVFGTIGWEITEGYHEPGVVLDRMRSVKIELVVLWYQEDQPQALDLLRMLAESRDLYRVQLWVLTPSQTVQIQFATKAQGLLFDGNDVVRWQRGQFEADFKRMLERVKAADNIAAAVGRIRRTWSEPGVPPLTKEQLAKELAPVAAALAKQPARLCWLKAEEALHAAARGDGPAALELATKLRDASPEMFDAHFVLAAAKAKHGEAETAAGELLDWVVAKKGVTPERALVMARAFASWQASQALRKLANVALQNETLRSTPQAHAVAAAYYRLGGKSKEAVAHLAKALASVPARVDYIMDLAESHDRRDASHAANLWDLVGLRGLAPKWYCLLKGAEALILNEKYDRALMMLEAGARENPASKELQQRLDEVRGRVGRKSA